VNAAARSCPDWAALTAHRADPRGEEPAGWREALAHLESCADCRREALQADPTLIFQRLSAAESREDTRGPEQEAEAVRQAVASLRQASRLTPRRRHAQAWTRAAAAAVLAVAGLTAGSVASLRGGSPPAVSTPVTLAGVPAPALSRRAAAVVPAALHSGPSQMPMLEELNRPDARVYQIDGENLSVVMIVDEGLDV